MSPQVAQFKLWITALQQDRSLASVEKLIREVCKGAAEACPVDDLIPLALYVAEMGLKAERDQIAEN